MLLFTWSCYERAVRNIHGLKLESLLTDLRWDTTIIANRQTETDVSYDVLNYWIGFSKDLRITVWNLKPFNIRNTDGRLMKLTKTRLSHTCSNDFGPNQQGHCIPVQTISVPTQRPTWVDLCWRMPRWLLSIRWSFWPLDLTIPRYAWVKPPKPCSDPRPQRTRNPRRFCPTNLSSSYKRGSL